MKRAALGTGLLLAPLVWFGNLEAQFVLAPLACAGYGKTSLLVVSLSSFLLALSGCFLSWSQKDVDRRLAVAGSFISALFAAAILAQTIPNVILGGCE